MVVARSLWDGGGFDLMEAGRKYEAEAQLALFLAATERFVAPTELFLAPTERFAARTLRSRVYHCRGGVRPSNPIM